MTVNDKHDLKTQHDQLPHNFVTLKVFEGQLLNFFIAVGEPNSRDSPEKCVELKGPVGRRGWNDWECEIRSTEALCEKVPKNDEK